MRRWGSALPSRRKRGSLFFGFPQNAKIEKVKVFTFSEKAFCGERLNKKGEWPSANVLVIAPGLILRKIYLPASTATSIPNFMDHLLLDC